MTFLIYALHYHIWPQGVVLCFSPLCGVISLESIWSVVFTPHIKSHESELLNKIADLSKEMYCWSHKIPLVSSRTHWDSWKSDSDWTEIVCVGGSERRNCESSRLRLQWKSCKCCLSVNEPWEAVFHLKATPWFQFCSLTLTSVTSTFFFFFF